MRFGSVGATESVSTDFIRTLKVGDTRVRFLQETDTWVQYHEHFIDRKSFPCPKHMDPTMHCPGCESDNEAVARWNRKYVANVLFVSTGQTALLKLPIKLVNKLVGRAERNGGTITSRDYTLIKTGSGFETDYDVDQEDVTSVDLSRYPLRNIEEALVESYQEIWGPGLGEVNPAKKSRFAESVKTRSQLADVVKDAGIKKASELEVPPTKPQVVNDEPEVTKVVTIEEVRAMSLRELYSLAEEVGVKVPDEYEEKSEIMAYLIRSMDKV